MNRTKTVLSVLLLALVAQTSFAERNRPPKEYLIERDGDNNFIFRDPSEKRQVQHVESGLRATAIAFLEGLAAVGVYGNSSKTHLVGVPW